VCDSQVVLGTNQQVVVFTQQPYLIAPQIDPVATITNPGENLIFISAK